MLTMDYDDEVEANYRESPEYHEPDIARCSRCDVKLSEFNCHDPYQDMCDKCINEVEKR